MMDIIIELNELELVAFHEILDQIQDVIVGIDDNWTEAYQMVLGKVIAQVKKQHNLRKELNTDDCKDLGCKDCFLLVDEYMSPYEKDMYCSMRKCVAQKERAS